MSNIPTYAYVCGLIILISTLTIFLVKAPKGYEDENGFHYGEPPAPPIEPKPEPENPFPNAIQTGVILEEGGKIILIRNGKAVVLDKSDLAIGD